MIFMKYYINDKKIVAKYILKLSKDYFEKHFFKLKNMCIIIIYIVQ